MATLSKGQLFPHDLVNELVNKVKGHSSLAMLSQQTPISFVGNDVFTFTMDKEIDIVAENGAKSEGGATIEPVSIVPIKFEYGMRVSDEFMYASEEKQIEILKAFADGFARKVAKGLDLAAMHGLNPRTNSSSTVVGTNNFDSKVTQAVQYDNAHPDKSIEDAIALVEAADGNVNGMALSTTIRNDLSKVTDANGYRMYPEFAFGGAPATLGGATVDINPTVGKAVDQAIVGDFDMFKWGYAKDIPIRVIEYGDPDNTGKDLQGYNQVYIRGEIYLGWGILDANSFARVQDVD